MATYKLIQDIEAEDHILGPLTLRQFIFALVAAFCFYLCFLCLAKLHAPVLLIIFLPPGLFCAFFAFPFGRDQPTEVWALAKLRFLFKPRRRIWNQSGIKELVTITVPKKLEPVLTDGLSQTEVKSRLQALANTIDSRGWAVKGVNVNAFAQPDPLLNQNSDRLIDLASLPREVPNYEVQASDDILDETSNPIAQQFTYMINESTQAHRRQIIDEMNRAVQTAAPVAATAAAPAANYWFMNDQPDAVSAQASLPSPVAAVPTADEAALAAQLKARVNTPEVSYAHLRTLQPLGSQPAAPPNQSAPQAVSSSTNNSVPAGDNSSAAAGAAAADPAILSLANNNDLNVATLARQAHRNEHGDQSAPDEVVISLH